jgi:hypothetical protein
MGSHGSSVSVTATHVSDVPASPVKLAVVRILHTIIYLIMASATLYVFYCGLAGSRNRLLAVAVTLVAFEGLVFLGNGMRCPLTDLAQKYGDPTGHVGDTFFPEGCTRYTFRAFGSLYLIGLALIAAEYFPT